MKAIANRLAPLFWAAVLGAGILAASNIDSAAAEPETAGEAPSPRAESLELVFLGADQLRRVAVDVQLDGESLVGHWDETFDWLLAMNDADNNGTLSQEEAARLPSAFALRQVLWQHYSPRSGRAPDWQALDVNGNGKVTRDELADFYRKQGLGGALIGIGRPPMTAALTDAFCKRCDADGNEQLEAAEADRAVELLATLDANSDELLGPGELVAGAAYPGAAGTMLLTAPRGDEKDTADVPPLVVLPLRVSDIHWAEALVKRCDRDGDGRLDRQEAGLAAEVFEQLDQAGEGSLSAEELAAWRKLPADACWTLHLDQPPDDGPDAPTAEMKCAGLAFELHAVEGPMPERMATARKKLLEEFAEADANHDGLIEAEETGAPRGDRMRDLRTSADRDGDEKLSRQELDAWIDFHEHVAGGHVLITLLDYGPGLFELLDVNHDGALSQRELRGVRQRLSAEHCFVDDRLDRARIPHQLRAVVSHGQPASVLTHSGSAGEGPQWFVSMDRNGDGDVSTREFIGSPDDFGRFDQDGDGLLSSSEALAVQTPDGAASQ